MRNLFLMSCFCFYLAMLFVACRSAGSTVNPAENQEIRVETTLKTEEKYGRLWVFFAQVNKTGNYFRRMFIDATSAEAMRQGNGLPANALFAMETWFGNEQSTVYLRQNNGNGEMLSGSFSPTRPNFAVSSDNSCNSCHQRARVTQAIFTLPLLQKSLINNQLQIIRCNQPSFTPCDLEVYQGN